MFIVLKKRIDTEDILKFETIAPWLKKIKYYKKIFFYLSNSFFVEFKDK